MKDEIIKRINKFTKERNWDQFHSPGNLAKSISIEANELLELFQWTDEVSNNKNKIEDELADIIIYAIQFAEKLDLDIRNIINNKIDKNEKKYPIDKSFGNAKKYTEFK